MKFQSLLRPTGLALSLILLVACGQEPEPEVSVTTLDVAEVRPEIYADFTLTADLSHLEDDQKSMIALLIEASEIMDDLFWRQSFGDDYASWLDSIDDPRTRRFAELNYGPWDALDDEKPFMDGFGPKPLGAQFYPVDMSREEFENAFLPGKADLYSFVRRDGEGNLTLVPYHVEYAVELAEAARLLREAGKLAKSPDFANYLRLRAAALISDDFFANPRLAIRKGLPDDTRKALLVTVLVDLPALAAVADAECLLVHAVGRNDVKVPVLHRDVAGHLFEELTVLSTALA